MDEVIIEPQVEAQVDVGMMQIDIEPFNDEKDANLMEENEVKGEIDLVGAKSEPYEGMEFESEEAARKFYSAYAQNAGFRVRISRYTRSRRDNSIISRLIVCSKEGFRESRGNKDGLVLGERKQMRQRVVTRVGCKAMLMVKKLAPGKWVVSKFVKEHNHGPVPPRKVEVRVIQREEDLVEETNGNLLSDGGEINEPFEGMEFDSEEDARTFYQNYARQMGFRARISKYCRSRKDNSIISRQIVCSKEGFREVRVKKESDDGRVKRPRVITRIGCKAMIIVKKLNTGKWVVSRFEKEHNHALATLKMETRILESSHDSSEKGLVTYMGGDDVHSMTGMLTSNGCCDGSQGMPRESLTVLYNKLCHEAIKYAQEGAVSEEIYNVAMLALKEAVEKVAAAKRSAGFVAKGLDAGDGSSITKCSNEAKKAASANELMLIQQPLKFVLIPSSSLTNDSNLADHSVESSMMLNIPNGQGISIPDSISVLKQSSPTAPLVKWPAGDGITDDSSAVHHSQKSNFVEAKQSKTTPGNGIVNLISAVASEAQMLAFPALPVTLYMPVMGNVSESSSVAMPGATSSDAYTIVAAPGEASSIAASSQSQLRIQQSATPAKDQSPRSYMGPNPQVHATAIAAGARIIPPEEAASLIKAIEARVRSSRSTFGSGFKQLTAKVVQSFLPPKELDSTDAPAEATEPAQGKQQVSSEETRSNENGGSKEMVAVRIDNSAVYDSTCEDHTFSDGST